MPSMSSPPASVPAATDVKSSERTSASEEQTRDPVVEKETKTAAKASKETELEVEESDLEALEEQKKVPYGRFKEKVDETKTLKQQIDALKKQNEAIALRAAEDAEIRVTARLAREKESESLQDLDPTERRIHSTDRKVSDLEAQLAVLKNSSESQAAQASVERLERKYPKADSLAVLGWAKARGVKASDSEAMEELMETSHNRSIERTQADLREILEHKKAKAKAAVPTREGGIRLKDSDRPKNLKEAAAMTRRLFGGDG